MKIPKHIDVHGKRWKILHKWGLRCDDGNFVDGLCDQKNRIIYIDHGSPKSARAGIFLHELLHAISVETKVCEVLDTKVEEIFVENIACFFIENFNMRLRDVKKR